MTHAPSLLAFMAKTALGVQLPGGGIRVAQGEAQGFVLSSAPLPIAAGSYELRVRCALGTPQLSSQPVLGIEILSLSGDVHLWKDFLTNELDDGCCAVRFKVDPAPDRVSAPTDYKIKIFHFANADIEIKDLTLAAVDPSRRQIADESQFRLLSRMILKKSAAWQTDGHVAVSRRKRAGGFLAGPRFLTLPEGHYRLDIAGSAVASVVSNRPVVGVEIFLQQHQLVFRDFSAEELARGNATIDFQVQRDITDSAAGYASLEFELSHFGNAELNIGAVNLTRMASPAAADNRSVWRLSGRLHDPRTFCGGAFRAVERILRRPLLAGVRPRLRLGVGRYRLTFDASGPALRGVTGPLLKVAVDVIGEWRHPAWLDWLARTLRWRVRTTRGHLAERRFTVEEIQGGRAALDFEAPTEWAYDNFHVWADVRLTPETSAALDVDNVSISSVPAADTSIAIAAASGVAHGPLRTRIAVFGNCQAEVIGHVLRHHAANRLIVTYHPLQIPERMLDQKRRELEQTDILLLQDISNWENHPLREALRDSTRVIGFPVLRLASLWPFDGYNGPSDPDATRQDWPLQIFPYLDGLLARLRKETPDQELRFARYAALQVELVADPGRLHKFEMRRLAAMDRRYGIELGAFIADRILKQPVFHTTSHPTGDVFAILLNHLAGLLEQKTLREPGRQIDHYFSSIQVPIHPKVAQMLGVTWANEDTRYRWAAEHLRWEDYVRRYISHFG